MSTARQDTLGGGSGEIHAVGGKSFDADTVRRDFPVLHQAVNGHPLVYLDNAASSQRPRAVIDAVRRYEEHDHANVHRGVHTLSQRATDAYEGAREKVRGFINAASTREIVFTRGTTEAINLVAHSFGQDRIGPGDEILISYMEHHSNIVPWQLLCERTGAKLRAGPINQRGELDLDAFLAMLGPRTRLVSIVHVSNALGTINPVEQIIAAAHGKGIPVMIDAAQAVQHIPVDVRALDCDFLAFSGHKMYAPTGIGVLYAREALLETLPPYQGGGEMILAVSFDKTVYNQLPFRFEAGTPNISGAVGLGAAIDYLSELGLEHIAAYEKALLDYGTRQLGAIPGLRFIGSAEKKASVISFVIDGIHPHDIGTIVDSEGVAVRTGHHCAMPVMEYFGVPATVRASLAFYNSREDIDRLVVALRKAKEVMG